METSPNSYEKQQTFNRNIVKRIQELEDRKRSKLDDQVDIKLMKQEEFNDNVDISLEELGDRIQELEDFKEISIKRFDQGIENRTIAFKQIEDLQDDLRMIKEYGLDGLRDSLLDYRTEINTKLERIDDILVVHSNQSDNQRKNHFQLQKVFSDKVMELLEGTHGKQK